MSGVKDEPFFLTARGSFSAGGLSAILVDEIRLEKFDVYIKVPNRKMV
jgi:hypothetical protein